ncbi:MAG: rhomboid family intramembrane serine protease [Candidatus Riflebacteria bacterium]|nr:rhomboid family intramembrane serine protease [Candidatus Riflebacteria bacterium]
MIFSLISKGVRVYKAYLFQLSLVLFFMLFSLKYDEDGSKSILISVFLLFLFVILPYILQKRIELLLFEQRFDELEWPAKVKSLLAWSAMNYHILELARAVKPFSLDPAVAEKNILLLLGRGEPFESLTRICLAQVYINQRKFQGIIDCLFPPNVKISELSSEEMIFITRSLLETERFEQAIELQIALEEKVQTETNKYFLDSVVVSRLLLFSFLGWKEDFENLLKPGNQDLPSLPPLIKEFWNGVTLYNSGKCEEGLGILRTILNSQELEFFPENWQGGIRSRYEELNQRHERFLKEVFPKLEEIKQKNHTIFLEKLQKFTVRKEPIKGPVIATYSLILLLSLSFGISRAMGNLFDIGDLVTFGANNAILVENGDYFRLFSCLFLHMGWIHFLMNILALYYIGPSLEARTGTSIFLGIFLISGLSGSIATVYFHPGISVGVSGAILGLLTASAALELFQKKKPRILGPGSKLSALFFIIFLNILIGFFEKGVDNSAHIGGMIGGFLSGLTARVFLKFSILRLFAKLISWVGFIIVLFILLSSISTSKLELPYLFGGGFERKNIESLGYKLKVPQRWLFQEPTKKEPEKFSMTGPLGERMDFLLGEWYENGDVLAKEYSDNRTKGILKNSELELKGVSDPASFSDGIWECWGMKWRLEAFGRPFVQKDYICLASQTVLFVQCLLPTDRDTVYDNFLKNVIGAIKPLKP